MEESKEELSVKKILRSLTEEEKKELFEVIRDGNNEKAKEIIETMEDINEEIKDDINYGGSALHVSCRYGRIELIKYLIELGVDVNSIDVQENSPLMKASSNGHIEIVKLLINAGADINYTDKYENSAISSAAARNHLEICELLISSGLDIDKCGRKSLFLASCHGNINIVRRLIELGVNVDYVSSQNGYTSLHYACQWNNFDIVKLLMEHGADETIKNKKGKTAIELSQSEEIKEFVINYKPSKFVLK